MGNYGVFVNIYECVTVSGYSFREQADMNFTYFRSNGNGRDTARLYRWTFLDRTKPNHQTFAAVYRNLAENGRFSISYCGSRKTKSRLYTWFAGAWRRTCCWGPRWHETIGSSVPC